MKSFILGLVCLFFACSVGFAMAGCWLDKPYDASCFYTAMICFVTIFPLCMISGGYKE